MSLMRCMNTATFELHTNEILFSQIGNFAQEMRDTKDRHGLPQLDKILGACITARKQGLQWMWIDNCCINKSDSSELSESINSMFKWYRDAVICLTYLSDVRKNSGTTVGSQVFRSFETGEMSLWFTRGWTLQELLAPGKLLFYDTDWNYLGSKRELAGSIEDVTGIAAHYLTSEKRCPDCLHCRQDELGGTSRNDTRGGYVLQPVWYFQPSLARSVWRRERGLLEASGCSDSQER
ncbi:hypothetical protein FOQG_15887 [Fusarium oxysporum f. sp. raphani 54005]|uniref:Heterokaryon incompatibility domain-containing protein n=1 Tax=Fusarium oxysporum f. sp. raphani 54005 TaxID=1089458 RepID=X0BCH9_FUSOX|nr:hypothetical protein FOQG_15887 [Fusarium oxysporum f. sp. raphani 54005]